MSRRHAGVDATPGEALDEILQRRLADLFENLLCDIVRLGAGAKAEMPYAHEPVRQVLGHCFAPLHRVGVVAEIQFSEPVALGVAYLDAGEDGTIWVEVEADEWTTLEAVARGWRHPLPCAQRRLVAEVDATCTHILQLGRGGL